jgi:hypothetical protein
MKLHSVSRFRITLKRTVLILKSYLEVGKLCSGREFRNTGNTLSEWLSSRKAVSAESLGPRQVGMPPAEQPMTATICEVGRKRETSVFGERSQHYASCVRPLRGLDYVFE